MDNLEIIEEANRQSWTRWERISTIATIILACVGVWFMWKAGTNL